MSLVIRLPYPDPRLMPNRKHGKAWQSTAKAKADQKAAAEICTQAALQAAGPQLFEREHIPLSLLFLTPDKRHRDLDNLLAASKAILDGMAQALGVDDKRFKPVLIDKVAGDGEGALIAAVGVTIVSGVAL